MTNLTIAATEVPLGVLESCPEVIDLCLEIARIGQDEEPEGEAEPVLGDDRDLFGAGHRKRRFLPVLVAEQRRGNDLVLAVHDDVELVPAGAIGWADAR